MHLLSYLVCVRRGEHTDSPGVFEGIRKIVQESGDSVRQTNGRENAWAEERVAAEGIKKGILRARKIRMNPRQVG